jgi:hypothetical protein
VPVAHLFIWSAGRSEWVNCPRDEITWLDRTLLSGNSDLTLHRSPRCPGLRYVHHRWELFSRDPTYQVYLAPGTREKPRDARGVQQAARQVLPVAPAQHYETLPVVLEGGTWLVSVGNWVVPLRLEVPAGGGTDPAHPGHDEQLATQEKRIRPNGPLAKRGSPPRPGAVPRVRAYFERNAAARMAVAYHYQEYILGLPGPQPVPMMDVVIALDLSGEGTISDYKKLLQGLIWSESGHQRELAEFLLANGLLTQADLELASKAAAANEASGKSEMARKRLKYRPRK